MPVKFEDNSIKVKAKLDDATIAFLHEAAGELKSQAQRNQTRVDTGDTKASGTTRWMKAQGLPLSETR